MQRLQVIEIEKCWIYKKSYTFEEILKGDNAVINYDSTISNIMDIVGELSKLNDCPKEADLIYRGELEKVFYNDKASKSGCFRYDSAGIYGGV